MIISDPHCLDYQPMSSLLISTILSALTILTAFCLRDSVVQGVQIIAPTSITQKFLFTTMITLFFLFVTVLVAFIWQDHI
jgi:hypothetical protein